MPPIHNRTTTMRSLSSVKRILRAPILVSNIQGLPAVMQLQYLEIFINSSYTLSRKRNNKLSLLLIYYQQGQKWRWELLFPVFGGGVFPRRCYQDHHVVLLCNRGVRALQEWCCRVGGRGHCAPSPTPRLTPSIHPSLVGTGIDHCLALMWSGRRVPPV